MKKCCVVGSGVIGSYAAYCFSNKNYHVDLYDIGNKKIKNESQIGFTSVTNNSYSGTSKGRYFGFGGTSEMWGGQILFFDKNDFTNPDLFTKKLIEFNEKYKECVSKDLGLNIPEKINLNSSKLGSEKNGFWLNPRKRNLFKLLNLNNNKKINLFPNHALVNIVKSEGFIKELTFINGSELKHVSGYDIFIIAIGAIEHGRLYMLENKLDNLNFRDHFSIPIMKVKSPGTLLNHNLLFKITNDRSLITKRLIGEISNQSYFLHPIFNKNIPVFEFIKNLIFKKSFDFKLLRKSLKNLRESASFLFSIAILKKFIVFKNEWILQLDFESDAVLEMTMDKEKVDKYGLNNTIITCNSKSKEEIITNLRQTLKEFLENNLIKGEILIEELSAIKPEDTYHPYNLIEYETMKDYLNEINNGLVISTAILPRVGGLNPTATLLPLLKYYVDEFLQEQTISQQ